MTQLPTKHLSVRVPWHDNGWNGTVCNKPQNNGSCPVLTNIQTKDPVLEKSVAGQRLDELTVRLPPCVSERGTFMSPFQIVRGVRHPYAHSPCMENCRRVRTGSPY